MEKNRDDDRVLKQILESDPAIRVAAFIEGAEVTGNAETARTKNVLSQSSDLRKKVGFWVSIVTEMARQTDKLFGSTEYVCVTHKGLKMVTVPVSARRSLGLSLDRSADTDNIILKIMTKFDLGSSD
jgi:recombinational DNA repair ATPase RecF